MLFPRCRTALAVLLITLGSRAAAQGTATDHIRGKVSDDSNKVVVGATVFITRGPDRAFKQTTTDAEGRFSVDFENGTGDYLVAVSAVGYKNERRRVQKQGEEHDFTANFVLGTESSSQGNSLDQYTNPADGTVSVLFDSGVRLVLGTLGLARFPVERALESNGDGSFSETYESGTPVVAPPLTPGRGSME